MGRSRLVASIAAVAVVAGLVQVVAGTAVSPHASRALAAAATGTAGQFVSAQGRLIDTRYATQVGPYSTQMQPNTWRTVTVDGALGGAIPASDVAAVSVTLTVVNPATSGLLHADKDEANPNTTVTYVNYTGAGGLQSNSAVLAVGSDGKIQVETTTASDLIIDVMGYYTDGDNVAAGGYIPITPVRLADTRQTGTGLPHAQLAPGTTSLLQVSRHGGIPDGAVGVVLNFAFVNETAGGWIEPYPADAASRPTGSVDYSTTPEASGVQVGLATTGSNIGAINIYDSTASTDLVVDVVGYFSATDSTGAFTPGAVRLIDTRTTGHTALAGGATVTVPVAGQLGIPAAGSGISAVTANLEVIDTGTSRSLVNAWATGITEPATSSVNYNGATVTSNMITTGLGPDGAIQIHNHGSDTIDFVIDVEGWYSNAGSAIPNGQRTTQQSVTLQADPTNAGSWATYKYRVGTVATFANVPVANTADSGGSHLSAWPGGKTSGTFTAYTWNIRDTLTAISGNNNLAPDSLVQVEACYGTSNTDPSPSCGMPANVQFAQTAFSAGLATTDIGPGTLGELTGDFQVSATDAGAASALSSLGVSRSLTTLAPPDAGAAPASQRPGPAGVFGPGWTADLSSDAGNADLKVTDAAPSGYLLFTGTDGGVDTYEATSPLTGTTISFVGVGDAAGNGEVVVKDVTNNKISMTDPDLTTTTWTKTGSGTTATWPVTGVTEPGSNSTTTYTYNAVGQVSRILAPVPAGVTSCSTPDTTTGCRSLILSYQSITVSGGSVSRLQKVTLSVPQVNGTASQVDVAAYDYTSTGLLADAYDPRMSPALKTAYTYNSAGRLGTLTPPGQTAYSFAYDSNGRLSTASRPDPVNGTATTTVVYDIHPLTSSVPIPMNAAATATWDETSDLPVAATAVFTPEHTPAGTTPGAVTSSDWPYASLDYMDVNGHTVNTAQYGAGAWQIHTTQYDANGNNVWDLTAGNRAQALNPTSDTDPYVATRNNVTAADLLASTTVVNPLDPTQTTDTFGPTHPITLAAGGTPIDGRTHISTTYDEGAPNKDTNPATGTAYDLPTTVVAAAFNVSTQNDTIFPDASITHTGYDPVVSGDTSGWTLGQATSSTVQMAGIPSSADLTTYIRYDLSGRTTETRLPGDSAGTGPRTTDTSYYTATGSGSCVSAASAGMVCSMAPGGQPATGNPLPIKTYTYNRYGEQTTETDSYGTGGSQVVRTLTDTYDAAGRPVTHGTAVSPVSAGGTALPTVTYGYDSALGLPTTTSTGSGASLVTLTTGYDTLGRTTSYTDAGGVTSTTGYDIDGNAVSVNDGKGTTTYNYDSSTEHRGLVTSEDLGISGAPSTFSATYNPDGDLAAETYPSGLTAHTDTDNAGNPTSLTYVKSGITWMTFTATNGAQDATVAETSPQSSEKFTFDAADRLVTTQDTDTVSGNCTTRAYTFDTHSNRTELDSYPAATGGACSTGTTPTGVATHYDSADRDTDAGYGYDVFGRTLSVPAADAHGMGNYATTSGTLSISYTANDMISTENQGSTTLTYNLDPNQDRVLSISDGTSTTTNHFNDETDSPGWTSTSPSAWTRDLTGPDGGLVASTDETGVVTLDLTDLHGDIVATASDDTTATAVTTYSESTEYGAPRTPSSALSPYGWLGAEQRSDADLGGLTIMGVRLYDPTTGRFLSADPIPGGNDNAYVYPADPINAFDLSGKCLEDACVMEGYAVYLGAAFLAGWASTHFHLHISRPHFHFHFHFHHRHHHHSSSSSYSTNPSCARFGYNCYSEHDTNKRKSNSDKHDDANKRRKKDQGQEKGDDRRRGNPNTRQGRARIDRYRNTR